MEVEDVSPNSTFTVEISGEPIGTIRTRSFGIGELELNTNDGQVVPKVMRGDLVQIFQGTELVLSGSFDDDDDDGNIEDGNRASITSAPNSLMQAGNSTIITIVITIPQDADEFGAAGAYSPNPALVSSGSTVTWNNIDNSPHTATADDGSFDTGIINGGSSGSALISASTGTRTIPYHCNMHPKMRGTLQDAPATVTNRGNNATIENLQEAILALQQAIGSLQQALVALHQSAPQDGNGTILPSNNNTAATSPIQEEPHSAIPPPLQPQLQQQQ